MSVRHILEISRTPTRRLRTTASALVRRVESRGRIRMPGVFAGAGTASAVAAMAAIAGTR